MVEFYPCKPPDDLPTVEELKLQYKRSAGLDIRATTEDGRVLEYVVNIPCAICGVYHKFGSKIQKKHNNRLAFGIMGVLGRTIRETEDDYRGFYPSDGDECPLCGDNISLCGVHNHEEHYRCDNTFCDGEWYYD